MAKGSLVLTIDSKGLRRARKMGGSISMDEKQIHVFGADNFGNGGIIRTTIAKSVAPGDHKLSLDFKAKSFDYSFTMPEDGKAKLVVRAKGIIGMIMGKPFKVKIKAK